MDYFLGIGAQKAGSTWLHDQLALHPEVAVPARKEVHYFDSVQPTRWGGSFGTYHTTRLRRALEQGQLRRAKELAEVLDLMFRPPAAYLDYLRLAADEHTRVVGEITPGYADLTEGGFAAVREVMDPRVVYVLRDPLERYWSMVRMNHTVRGQEGDLERSFRNAIGLPGNWSRCDYSSTLAALEAVFSPDRVLVLFYEELFSAASLARVARFLGVAEEWDFDLGRVSNQGMSRDMPEPPAEVLDRLLPVYADVRARYGDAVPASWQR